MGFGCRHREAARASRDRQMGGVWGELGVDPVPRLRPDSPGSGEGPRPARNLHSASVSVIFCSSSNPTRLV